MAVNTPARSLDDVLASIRPEVRNQHAYIVGLPPDVSVKLNQNESPFDIPEDLRAALLERMAEMPFNRYPTEQPDRLRRALAAHDDVDPDSIIVGNGSNELTYTLGLAFIAPDTPVVLPRPMFSLYEKVGHLYGGNVIGIPPNDDLSFDVDAIVEAVKTHEPTLTVITTPNNPTGRAVPLDDVERVIRAAAPGMVVVDEAYVEFNPEGSATALLDTYPNIIILRTLSKAFGLAGLRLGYLIAHPDVAHELMKSRLPFMVDRFAEAAGLALLDRPALLEERVAQMKASTDELVEALQARNDIDVVPTTANFVIFRPPIHGSDLHARLSDEGVLIRDMSGYPELDGYLRVCGGTAEENKAFLTALDRTLDAA